VSNWPENAAGILTKADFGRAKQLVSEGRGARSPRVIGNVWFERCQGCVHFRESDEGYGCAAGWSVGLNCTLREEII